MNENAAASDLDGSIISDSEPGIADKRQLNLNHEYERSEREEPKREREREREKENDRHAKRGSSSFDGNLVVAL